MPFLFWRTASITWLFLQTKCPKRFPKAASWGHYWKQNFQTLHLHLWSTRRIMLGDLSWWTGSNFCVDGDVPKASLSFSTQPSHPEEKRGPRWAINLQPAFYIPGRSSALCFQVCSLPFLKEMLYYPGKSCGFPLISIFKSFQLFLSLSQRGRYPFSHDKTPFGLF